MKHEDNLEYIPTSALSTGETESFVWNAYRSNATKVQAAILMGVGFMFWSGAQAFFPPTVTDTIHFLDVGQGDAALITLAATSNHEPPVRILVDGGRDGSILSALSDIESGGDFRYIDLIILSHQDTDHYGGLVRVLEQYEVGALISNGNHGDGEGWRDFLARIDAKNIPHHILTEANTITYNDAQLDMLLPTEELRTQESLNEASLVFTLTSRYETGTTTVLFTGDIGHPAEEMLLAKGIPLDVDILKVGHHGSKYSSSPAFIHATAPAISVISVGKNSYGHPASEVLDTLSRAASAVYTTLEHDTVRIPLDPATSPLPKATDRGFLASVFLGPGNVDSSTTITLKETLDHEKEMTLVPVTVCQFDSPVEPAPKTVRINEVAWMGTLEGATHEWIELLRIHEEPVNISGWQIINENGRVHATFPQDTVLHEQFAIAGKNQADEELSLDAETHFTGALRNTNEGLRLFDNECRLIDEISMSSTWPAGDNASKRTMERREDGVWVDSLSAGGTPRLPTSGTVQGENIAHEEETAGDEAYVFAEFEQLDDGTFSVPVIATHLQDTGHDIKIALQNESGSDISETYNEGLWRASLYYLPEQCTGTACDLTLRLKLAKKHETFSGNATLLIRIREHGKSSYIEHRTEVRIEEHAYAQEKIAERKVPKTTSVPAKKETAPISSITAQFPETVIVGESVMVLVSGKDFAEAPYDIKVSIEADRILSRTYGDGTWRSSQFYLLSAFTGPAFTDIPVTIMIATSSDVLPPTADLVIRARTGDGSGIELFRQQVSLQAATGSVEIIEEAPDTPEDEEPNQQEEPETPTEPEEESPTPEPSACININTADETALLDIIQIGPALAAKIVLERMSERGLFISIDDLVRVSGIGPATIAKIYTQGKACV